MTTSMTPQGCPNEDLVLYIYDDLPEHQRASIAAHIDACGACRVEVSAMEKTLGIVDAAHLPAMATFDEPGDWEEIRERLDATPVAADPPAQRTRRPVLTFAKAAGVLLAIGLAFTAGRQWDEILTGMDIVLDGDEREIVSPTEGQDGPEDSREGGLARLEQFNERSNGYFGRSRLVLLEFANADAASDSPALRAASRNLVRETASARRIAGQIHDETIETLVRELGAVLSAIADLPQPLDPQVVKGLKLSVEGVLDRLELMSRSAQIAEDRSRT